MLSSSCTVSSNRKFCIVIFSNYRESESRSFSLNIIDIHLH
nr:MAG TPA: hypothetical protein [Caudoviricetes sp.]DAS81026.1 MAG TPA: hypothetical protein [Bacteriophage sp.]